MAIVRMAFQMKNLIMECLVTTLSFQVIFEWARKATMTVMAVEINEDSHSRLLSLIIKLARIV